MAEWLILLVLIPAIVVPVVVLAGFTGCDKVWGLIHVDDRPSVPMLESADGISGSVITLKWKFYDEALEFVFERLKVKDGTTTTFHVAPTPGFVHTHDDDDEGAGLEPETEYLYRVRAIEADGEGGEWSNDRPNVFGQTLGFETTFEWTRRERTAPRDVPRWEGYCLVQRIEATRLSKGGRWIKLTLRGSAIGSASIERIYVSPPDPGGNDAYDSAAADMREVTAERLTIPASSSVTVPVPTVDPMAPKYVRYTLDPEQALLIAIDFSAAPIMSAVSATDPANIQDPTPVDPGSYFFKQAVEAAQPQRAGFTGPRAGIQLIEKIEVA
jgi:hypothetical protein